MNIDFTKPLQTRDGRSVRVLATDAKHSNYPVVGLIDQGGMEVVHVWTLEGRYNCAGQSGNDLVHPPQPFKREGWVNIYPDPMMSCVWKNRKDADDNALETRIACVPITVEGKEGDGL